MIKVYNDIIKLCNYQYHLKKDKHFFKKDTLCSQTEEKVTFITYSETDYNFVYLNDYPNLTEFLDVDKVWLKFSINLKNDTRKSIITHTNKNYSNICYTQFPNLTSEINFNSVGINIGLPTLLSEPYGYYTDNIIKYMYRTHHESYAYLMYVEEQLYDADTLIDTSYHVHHSGFRKWLDNNNISLYTITDEQKMMFEMEKALYL